MLFGGAIVALTPMVSHSFGRSTYGLLLPAIEDTLGLSHARTGLGGTTIYAAYLVGVLTVASLAARVEPVMIMRGGVLVGAVGLAWLSTAHSLGALLVGLAFTGAAGAGIWVTAPAILTASVSDRRRGLVIGLLTASTGLGTFLVGEGTNLARHAAGDDNLWRPVFLVEAAATLVLLAGLVLVVRAASTGSATGGGGSGSVGTPPTARRKLFNLDRLRGLPHWGRVTAAYALFAAVGAGFTPFLVRALRNDAGLRPAAASSLFAVMGLAAIPGAPAMGYLSDRYGRTKPMVVVLTIAALGTTIVALGRGVVAGVGVLCFGAVWSSYPTLTATFVRDHLEARAFNEAFSTMTIFYSLAALTAPFLTGWLADRTGHFRTPFLILAGLCLVGAALVARLPAQRGVAGGPSEGPAPAPDGALSGTRSAAG